MKTRAATFWHVSVRKSVDRQWQIFFERSGRVVFIGETRQSKAQTVATAKLFVKDAGAMFVFDGVIS